MGLKQLVTANSTPMAPNDISQIIIGIIPLLLMFSLQLWGKRFVIFIPHVAFRRLCF